MNPCHSGKDLQKMFLEHGSFEAMEITIKKKHIESASKSKAGGWFTKSVLEHTHMWTKIHGHYMSGFGHATASTL